jgi:hypothetical protein
VPRLRWIRLPAPKRVPAAESPAAVRARATGPLSGWESLHHGADRPCMVGAAGQGSTTPMVSSCLMISARKQENIFGRFG